MKELLVRYRPKKTLRSVNKGIKTMATELFQTEPLGPVSNVVLLPCQTQLIEINSTLARQ